MASSSLHSQSHPSLVKAWLIENGLEKYWQALQNDSECSSSSFGCGNNKDEEDERVLVQFTEFTKKGRKRFFDRLGVSLEDRGTFGEALGRLKQDGVEAFKTSIEQHKKTTDLYDSDGDVNIQSEEPEEEDEEEEESEDDEEDSDDDTLSDTDTIEQKHKFKRKLRHKKRHSVHDINKKLKKLHIRKKKKKKLLHLETEDDFHSTSSDSGSETGRESDDEYEMDFDKIAEVLKEGVKYEVPEDAVWRPLNSWKKPMWDSKSDYLFSDDVCSEGYEEKNALFLEVPLSKRLAGSIHKIKLFYFKTSSGRICKRLVKIARSSDEDKKEHFYTELYVNHYLLTIAEAINNTFVSRTDVCIWPVEVVTLEIDGELKFALAQAPFLPPDRYEFVKVEPNNGEPVYNDRVVGRYQHAFAAFSRGLSMIRDWQGFGVPRNLFVEQCQLYCPEALQQIRNRPSHIKGTDVLVSIDPVLITSGAHFIADNATDFGIASMDEWQKTHDCKSCRCHAFKLLPEICWGLADVDQKFFENDAHIEKIAYAVCKKLRIWTGHDDVVS